MSRVHKLTALVFLVLWVPLTAHCYLEKVTGLEFLKCASDTPESSDCQGDACQTVESGFYKVPDNSGVLPPPATLVQLAAHPERTESATMDSGPCDLQRATISELPQSWQFLARTALPVRAPSLLS